MAPLELPIGSQDAFAGVVNLIEQKAYMGDKGTPADIPADMAAAVASAREQLVEAVAEADDDLLAKYLEGEEPTPDELTAALKKGIAAGVVYPVFACSAAKNIGVGQAARRARRRWPVAGRRRAAQREVRRRRGSR